MGQANNIIETQAREWFTLLNSSQHTQEDRQRFDTWLSESDYHIQAYIELEQLYETLEELQYAPEGQALAKSHRAESEDVGKADVRNGIGHLFQSISRIFNPQSSNYHWGIGGASLAVVVLAFTLFFLPQDSFIEYTTEKGQILSVTLEDSSTLFLGGNSKLAVNFSKEERLVRHLQGEVFFDVAKDLQRPFHVNSGNTHIRVTGTQFGVNRRSGSVRVGVLEGRVEVSQNRTPEQHLPSAASLEKPVVLNAGEKVVANKKGNLSLVSAISSDEVIGWQSGKLVYRNEALADVIEDLNRYSEDVIFITHPNVESLKVTMSFNVEDLENIPSLLETILPVKPLENRAGNILFVPKR